MQWCSSHTNSTLQDSLYMYTSSYTMIYICTQNHVQHAITTVYCKYTNACTCTPTWQIMCEVHTTLHVLAMKVRHYPVMPTEQCVHVFLILYIHSIYGIILLYMYITKYGCVFLTLGERTYVAMDLIPILFWVRSRSPIMLSIH